jgi:predicted ATP-dependent endonuclease of OLD family
MYIKDVYIKGFRNFSEITVELKPFTTVIGKNDEGKSNFLDAISLVLYGEFFSNRPKTLGLSDINKDDIVSFNDFIIDNKEKIIAEDLDTMNELIKKVPYVNVCLTFVEPDNDYEKGLLKDFIMGDEKEQYYQIEYMFRPKDDTAFIEYISSLAKTDATEFLSIEFYEYDIYSKNNGKSVSYLKRQSFLGNFIFAERDLFAQDNTSSSMDLVSKILEKTVSNVERVKINDLYKSFFEGLKDLNSFKELFLYLTGGKSKNLEQFVDTLELKPNTPKFRSIFSNIKISYGDEYLHQKGLGKRNFMYILLLFSYFNKSDSKFNLIGIEEPESHLSADNLRLIMSFIYESVKIENTLNQFIVTTHRPEVINKLRLDNVVVLNECTSIPMYKVEKNLVDYLSKRPNLDILKILFAKRLCLVEGVTEEMFINTVLDEHSEDVFDVEVISIGQRGFRSFMDIWLKVNAGTSNKLLVIRDFDDLEQSKIDHEKYETENLNIKVATTKGYTFEDDLVNEGGNKNILATMYSEEEDSVLTFMKSSKAESMLQLCQSIVKGETVLEIPEYIKDKLQWLKKSED